MEGILGFKQEKLIEHFFLCSHNGTHEDIRVQVIGHCDPNDQEAREDFWVFHLDALDSQGLKKMHIKMLNKLIQYFNEQF